MSVGLGLRLVFVCACLGLAFGVLFCFRLDFVLVLFAFVVLGLVSSELRQEISWEERLQNDLFLCRVGRKTLTQLEMWANAQRDGRPAERRWRPLFNAAKFG